MNRVALPDSPSLPKVAPRKRVAAPKFFEPRRGQIRGPNPSFRERSGEATQADVDDLQLLLEQPTAHLTPLPTLDCILSIAMIVYN